MQSMPAPAACCVRPLDYRLDLLLQGVAAGVHKRIVSFYEARDANTVPSPTADPAQWTDAQAYKVYTMSNAWQIACATGAAQIGGDDAFVRTCAVGIQHCVENWLTERLSETSRFPFAVVAAIHTPAPPTPLRHRCDTPAATTLFAPHLRDDAGVRATVEQRARSVRDLLKAGATLHVCYPAASLGSLNSDERAVYRSTCEDHLNLIDRPSPLPPDAFRASCGATYLFGSSQRSLTGCFAIRLPQAADAVQGPAAAYLFVASPFDGPFKGVLDELSRSIGLALDPVYGGVAMRATSDESDHVRRGSASGSTHAFPTRFR